MLVKVRKSAKKSKTGQKSARSTAGCVKYNLRFAIFNLYYVVFYLHKVYILTVKGDRAKDVVPELPFKKIKEAKNNEA